MYTGLFTAGLKLGVPYERLVSMHVPVLLMMIDSQYGDADASERGASGTRPATQADINALFCM